MQSLPKKVMILGLFFVFILGATNVFAVVEGVRVSSPDTCWYTGNFINYPISIEWTKWGQYKSSCPQTEYSVPPAYDPAPSNNKCKEWDSPDVNMFSFEMTLTFNSYSMQAVTVVGDTLISNWTLHYDINNSMGRIVIAGASATPVNLQGLTDPRKLVNVGFLINGANGTNTGFKVTSFTYNEVDPLYVYWGNNLVPGYDDAKSIGDLMICETEYVKGKVTYGSVNMPICDAVVTLTYFPDPNVIDPPDINNKFDTTSCDNVCQNDCRGEFMVLDVTGGYKYCLSVFKDDQYDNAITAFDASLILRYLVNQVNFDNRQKIAADVSGDCTISAYDASLILRYLVGNLPNQPYFPKKATEHTNWVFYTPLTYESSLCPNETYCYNPLTYSQENQNFEATILGDVSGNWGAAAKLSASVNESCQLKKVSMNSEKQIYELTTSLPNVYGCQFDINVPQNAANVVTVKTGTSNLSWNYEINNDNGRIRVATAGVNAISDGVIATITVEGDANIELDNLVINEIAFTNSLAVDGNLPLSYSLADSYPNPFNPETQISFTLPNKSDVNLIVYNLLGQQVKVLASGTLDAGEHHVSWNGTDNSGSKVASGIYLYRLETSSFVQTKKMILLK